VESKLHLDRLYVKNFRALDQLTLEGLGRVNVFVGRNNSGKSTILDAIELLVSSNKFDVLRKQADKHGELDDERSRDRDFTFVENFFSGRSLPRSFDSILLESSKNSFVLSHYFVKESQIEELFDNEPRIRIKRQFIEKDTLDGDSSENYRALSLTVNGKRVILADNENNPEKYIGSSIHLSNRLNSYSELFDGIPVRYVSTKSFDSSYLDNLWGSIQFNPEMNNILISALNLVSDNVEIFGFMQVSPSRSRERKALVKLKDFDKPVPLSSMGDGMSRVLHIVLSLLNAKDGVLLIDEMENGLHYRIQENLWRIIFEFSTKLNIQVFVTTHSWDVIESFSKIAVEHPEEGVLYSLGRSGIDGKLNAHRYSEERLYQVTQSEMEVR
jgi:AAA15 family ATPase/GTPase